MQLSTRSQRLIANIQADRARNQAREEIDRANERNRDRNHPEPQQDVQQQAQFTGPRIIIQQGNIQDSHQRNEQVRHMIRLREAQADLNPSHGLKRYEVNIPGARLTIIVPNDFIWTTSYQRRLDSIFAGYETHHKNETFKWKCNRAVQRLQYYVNAKERIYRRIIHFIEENQFDENSLVEFVSTD